MKQETTVFRTAGLVKIGIGVLAELADEVKRLGGTKVLIVTDKGVADAGLVDKVAEPLKVAGIPSDVFDGVEPEPPIACAESALAVLKEGGHDLLIGVGGGSSMDVTKVVSLIATNEPDPRPYFGIDLIPRPGLPKILVPTTSGTGSEVTAVAILTDTEQSLKRGIVSPYMFADVALVDAEMMCTMPPKVTAATGMDALIHAVEAIVSVRSNSISDSLGIHAVELIARNLRTAFENGGDTTARLAMATASTMAGMAFANSSCCAVHALAYPLGGEYHMPHGVANTLMLAPVMEYNRPVCKAELARVAEAMGEVEISAKSAVRAMIKLAKDVEMPLHLKEFGIAEEDVPRLAESAAKVTRLLDVNPRRPTQEDIAMIYRAAL
ncbi:MAG: iron-containing alcohol dehydrogenase [Planctomycetes bacterium]|nr:iron-containing alcohol dehydrogenase [Planctomycetota bacterium]